MNHVESIWTCGSLAGHTMLTFRERERECDKNSPQNLNNTTFS